MAPSTQLHTNDIQRACTSCTYVIKKNRDQSNARWRPSCARPATIISLRSWQRGPRIPKEYKTLDRKQKVGEKKEWNDEWRPQWDSKPPLEECWNTPSDHTPLQGKPNINGFRTFVRTNRQLPQEPNKGIVPKSSKVSFSIIIYFLSWSLSWHYPDMTEIRGPGHLLEPIRRSLTSRCLYKAPPSPSLPGQKKLALVGEGGGKRNKDVRNRSRFGEGSDNNRGKGRALWVVISLRGPAV